MKLSVCQTGTLSPTPHCRTNTGSHTNMLMQTRTQATHTHTHTFVSAACRLEVAGILQELQGTLLLFSLQFTCLYKPVIKTLAYTQTHTHKQAQTPTHTHSVNPSEMQKAAVFVPHSSPLSKTYKPIYWTFTHKHTWMHKQVQPRQFSWSFVLQTICCGKDNWCLIAKQAIVRNAAKSRHTVKGLRYRRGTHTQCSYTTVAVNLFSRRLVWFPLKHETFCHFWNVFSHFTH